MRKSILFQPPTCWVVAVLTVNRAHSQLQGTCWSEPARGPVMRPVVRTRSGFPLASKHIGPPSLH